MKYHLKFAVGCNWKIKPTEPADDDDIESRINRRAAIATLYGRTLWAGEIENDRDYDGTLSSSDYIAKRRAIELALAIQNATGTPTSLSIYAPERWMKCGRSIKPLWRLGATLDGITKFIEILDDTNFAYAAACSDAIVGIRRSELLGIAAIASADLPAPPPADRGIKPGSFRAAVEKAVKKDYDALWALPAAGLYNFAAARGWLAGAKFQTYRRVLARYGIDYTARAAVPADIVGVKL